MNKNHYENTIDKIKLLIKENKKEEAIKILEIELNMPYIPEKYEYEFNNFYENIISEFKLLKDSKNINIDKVIEMLFSNSDVSQAIAIKALEKSNLRPIANTLKNRIETWEDKSKKSILFEIMHEQEIDIEINFNNKFINPKRTSIFDDKIAKVNELINNLIVKQPQLLEVCVGLLHEYVMNIFPERVVDPAKLSQDIFVVASKMINDDNNQLTVEQNKILNLIKK